MKAYLDELHDLDVVWEGNSSVLEQQCSNDTCATAIIVSILQGLLNNNWLIRREFLLEHTVL